MGHAALVPLDAGYVLMHVGIGVGRVWDVDRRRVDGLLRPFVRGGEITMVSRPGLMHRSEFGVQSHVLEVIT